MAALALVAAAAAAACGGGGPDTADADATQEPPQAAPSDERVNSSTAGRPVVETVPRAPPLPFLDPEASPETALGRLRARHLPVWSPVLDWAFPPEACHSAWELDGIAEPDAGANLTVLGHLATAATLTVMRFEHQLSRALADPSPLSQLCVAVASTGSARSESLDILAAHIADGLRRSEPAAYPEQAVVVALSPTAALAVACVSPGYPAVVAGNGEVVKAAQSPARLQAYLLRVARGMEDPVTDISYRVADTEQRPAEDCEGLPDWATEWEARVQRWIAEGQIWEPLGETLTAEAICESPPSQGPKECPKDWPL